MTGFYRRFIDNFTKIAQPLNYLLRDAVKFHWGPQQQLAFEILKDNLVGKPIFTIRDPELPIVIVTDASDMVVGAVLAQEDPVQLIDVGNFILPREL